MANGNTAFAFVRTGLKEPVRGAFAHEKCSPRRLFTAARFQRNTAPGWAMGITWRLAGGESEGGVLRKSEVEAIKSTKCDIICL